MEELTYCGRVFKAGNSLVVAIPRPIRLALRLRPGDWVVVKIARYKKEVSESEHRGDLHKE